MNPVAQTIAKPQLIRTCRDAHQRVAEARLAGKSIGLIPTMGALHEGHLSLVKAARQECDYVAVSIFVNPTQFGETEDLGHYPRTLREDLEALARYDVDMVFHPSSEEIYPQEFSTFVQPPKVGDDLEGKCRPGHFRGVATVVLQLFQVLPADVAYFGCKDYQQCLVVRDMVRDLHLATQIRPCPIVREPDGLAMSSRNRYLNSAERETSLAIARGLERADQRFQSGERDPSVLENAVRESLTKAGIERIDYVELRCAQTLRPLQNLSQPAVILVAAYVGSTRLIDNRQLASSDELT